jgi:hypothetical protein
VGVEGDPVDDRGDQAGVGEDGAPFAKWQVGPDRDGGSFVPFGDDLEEQLGAAGVDLDVAELVDLCGCPHRWIYADAATMPRVSVVGSHWRDDAGVSRRLTGAGVGIVAG